MTCISFMASHGGSAAKKIISAMQQGDIDADIGIVLTNNIDSEIYRWCKASSIRVDHISRRTHPDRDDEDKAIRQALSASATDWLILSGYMKKIGPHTLGAYPNRILNIHPSLLPRHGGKGLYGDRVHQAVLNSGDKASGATVHLVNTQYDEGRIIAQQTVTVSPAETVSTLRRKVQAIEGELYIVAINKLLKVQIVR